MDTIRSPRLDVHWSQESNEPIVHLVSGYRGHGKTTFATDLSAGTLGRWKLHDAKLSTRYYNQLTQSAYSLPVVALADRLKDEWYHCYQPPFPRDELDQWKDRPLLTSQTSSVTTYRDLIVQHATKQLATHGTDYYCRLSCPMLDRGVIISDWRRADEYDYFRRLAGDRVVCWRVVRPDGDVPPAHEEVEHQLDHWSTIRVTWRQ